MSSAKTLYLIDAYAIIFRAYFAFSRNPLINSKGLNVSAISGFTSTLVDLLQNDKPTHLVVVADAPGGSFRTQDYDLYKANRQETPEDIKLAMPYIRKIVEGFNIPLLEIAGYEADDVIGTIAKKAAADGFEVYMVTPDKDFGQLVEENIKIYKPASGKNPKQILGVAEIQERWEIESPLQVIDILGLMGDAVDNIPGIPGVGEKTAIKLIKEFGSVENLIKNVDQLSGKLFEKVSENAEQAIMSKHLATIVTDVPCEYLPETYIIEPVNREMLSALFVELEFRTLGRRILGDEYSVNQAPPQKMEVAPTAAGQLNLFGIAPAPEAQIHQQILATKEAIGKNIDNTDHQYFLVNTAEDCQKLLEQLLQQNVVCFDTETTNIDPLQAELVGIAFAWKATEAYYVNCDAKNTSTFVAILKAFFENEKISKVGQNIKYDLLVLQNYDIAVKGILEDTMIAHYLIEPEMRHNMNFLAETYLGYSPVSIETLIGKKGKKQLSMRDVSPEKVKEYAAEDADITWQLHEKFALLVKDKVLANLYENVEMPLVGVLAAMEAEGVKIDVPFLQAYSETLGKEINDIQVRVYHLAGISFNLDSPKQVGEVLFDRMKIPYQGKKTKTGQYVTDEAKLQELAAQSHEIAEQMLRYRSLSKLKNTYVDALPQLINSQTQRIHTSFNQAVTSTGRLSSNNPNLQNIPIRTEEGREIRKAFIARNQDYCLLSADYSQIELRIMAALSEDQSMISDFQHGLDIHTATAAKVFGVSLDEVDSAMRRKAKMVNFGIIYGISAFGLSQRLGISRSEAADIIQAYFTQYPGIKNFMQQSVEKAREQGFAETILGRRRYLKDIHSKNATVRSFAERNAINMPIQGSAADMIKMAMIHIQAQLQKEKMLSKMILQVHDELLFDVYKPELADLRSLVTDKMENALPLAVPIKVESGIGENWLDAH
ncbi:MAG: DNA polymerase I [Chitinophagales bacterium]|nr:DNA polymerase I [Bacteroidota bacterium]